MRLLLLNQCFYPDVMATAQQLTSLAVALRERGHEVTVVASARGYDDPSRQFPRRETWKGISINRIWTINLGKTSRLRRALNFMSFLASCVWRLLTLPRFDCVVGLTSPPLISVLGALYVRLKGGQFFFWVMDLNPDEAIAAGWLKKDTLLARFLNRLLRYSLHHSMRVIVLDRFMKHRIEAKGVASERIEVISPWSFDDAIAFDEKGREAFRMQHGLENKYVVMHAGNHSPCHPLDTLLEAARRLADRKEITFCFVGGGSEQAKVAQFANQFELKNILCLPYQPLERLGGMLSAADLHVAVMGDPFVGIVHPSKIYNILSVGTPLLYIGPEESSIKDVVTQLQGQLRFYEARHGEAKLVAEHIVNAASHQKPWVPTAQYDQFSMNVLVPKFIALLESGQTATEGRLAVELP